MEPLTEQLTLVSHLPPALLAAALRRDVSRGMSSTPRSLPSKWRYDERGSVLFEQVTSLPEYYLTRAEREILVRHAAAVAAACGARTLVELGPGASDKTRLLIEALRTGGTLRTYVPLDVNPSALLENGRLLVRDYPGLEVHAVLADFEHQLDVLPADDRRLTAFLGSTIGTLEPEPRAEFLADLRASTGVGDWLLLGTDLVKDPAVLVAAYDDRTGVTARFNRNALLVLNRRLGADADPEAFEHVALWDAERERVEVRLRSARDQKVTLEALDLVVPFAVGDEVRTEVSAKFRPQGVAAELSAAGFAVRDSWTDTAGRFLVTLAEAR